MNQLILAALGIGLLTVGCGTGDGSADHGSAGSTGGGGRGGGREDPVAAGDAGAFSDEVSGGAGQSGDAGSSGAGSSGAGSSAAGSNAAGSSAAGSTAAGGAGSGDCELAPAIVSCYVDAGQGTGVCTETAFEGTAPQVIRDQCGGTVSEGAHCPAQASLVGYCKGGITTYYYESAGGQIWANVGSSCQASGGVWCEN